MCLCIQRKWGHLRIQKRKKEGVQIFRKMGASSNKWKCMGKEALQRSRMNPKWALIGLKSLRLCLETRTLKLPTKMCTEGNFYRCGIDSWVKIQMVMKCGERWLILQVKNMIIYSTLKNLHKTWASCWGLRRGQCRPVRTPDSFHPRETWSYWKTIQQF